LRAEHETEEQHEHPYLPPRVRRARQPCRDPEHAKTRSRGPTARFIVTDNRVDSLSTVYGDGQFFNMGINGMALSEAIKEAG
jgi:hypothetical protein